MRIDYVDIVAMKYGKFKVREYLTMSGHDYAIFIIDYSMQEIIQTDGIVDVNLLESCKEGGVAEKKGVYALYGERIVETINNPVEVFMIDKDLWESEDEKLKELLVFHEICHLLEKREYYKTLGSILTDDEQQVGKILSDFANHFDQMSGGYGHDEDHNQLFGALLYHYLKEFNQQNCRSLLQCAMSKNFYGEYPDELRVDALSCE